MGASSINLAPLRRRLEFVPILLGLVLIVAAVLKIYQAATEPLMETSWVVFARVSGSRGGVGATLGTRPLDRSCPAGSARGRARLLSLHSRSTMCIRFIPGKRRVAASGNSRSIPCIRFGSMSPRFSPWASGDPNRTASGISSSRFAGVLAVYLAAGTGAGLAMGGMLTSTLDKQGKLSGSGSCVILEPRLWVGNRLPLLKLYRHRRPAGEGRMDRRLLSA